MHLPTRSTSVWGQAAYSLVRTGIVRTCTRKHLLDRVPHAVMYSSTRNGFNQPMYLAPRHTHAQWLHAAAQRTRKRVASHTRGAVTFMRTCPPPGKRARIEQPQYPACAAGDWRTPSTRIPNTASYMHAWMRSHDFMHDQMTVGQTALAYPTQRHACIHARSCLVP